MLRRLIWGAVAAIVTRPAVAGYLIRRAQRTPYFPITGPDGSLYMDRWWLFNPYRAQSDGKGKRWSWLPSIRIHHIMRPDTDRHLHDHPWNARTIVLDGWYREERPLPGADEYVARTIEELGLDPSKVGRAEAREVFQREPGYTGRLLFGQFHRISEVSPGGVWTLFITWRTRGTWGFDVDGTKVPWREYLGVDEAA